ncbi:spr peptidase [Sinobacterium caligoides]|uniref:Spr peptidase n=1 Tax=Sinobacterium caligoides TaxID=933926 RepID=A0A3N2E2I8_9GAMM|nr:NlpC/P60 family protein [Sinobacterium caligoides]ROS05785.1 spr peptidase [Sinobacterium caligoides]
MLDANTVQSTARSSYSIARTLSCCVAMIILLGLAGCSSSPSTRVPVVTAEASSAVPLPHPPNAQPPYQNVLNQLYIQHKEWLGVPYRFGGTTRKGIDCSAFVQRTFQERLQLPLPRTTRLQSTQGKQISRNELVPGDLVFFKTGRNRRHVGIYMGSGEFLHASSTHGVMRSKLNNSYWRRHYWQARRVIQ